MTNNHDNNQPNPFLEQIQKQFFQPKEEPNKPKRRVSQEAFDRLKAPDELMDKIKQQQLEQSAIEETTFDGTTSIFKKKHKKLSQPAEPEVERNFKLILPRVSSGLPQDVEDLAVSMGLKELYDLEYHMKDTVLYTEHVKQSVEDLRNLLLGNFSAMEGYHLDPNDEELQEERLQYIHYLYEKYKNLTIDEVQKTLFPSLQPKPKTVIKLTPEQEQAAISYAVSTIEYVRQELQESQVIFKEAVETQSPVLYHSFLKLAIENATENLHAAIHPLLADAKFLVTGDYDPAQVKDSSIHETFMANRAELLYQLWKEMNGTN
jgi:hypothetical protein